ncbi:MAG: hypothetical protein KGH66_03960 [Candidatus Micrarchaeota archaeon]|nr:hypothetical protein [Candidatus Micrarchaeota archaeon]
MAQIWGPDSDMTVTKTRQDTRDEKLHKKMRALYVGETKPGTRVKGVPIITDTATAIRGIANDIVLTAIGVNSDDTAYSNQCVKKIESYIDAIPQLQLDPRFGKEINPLLTLALVPANPKRLSDEYYKKVRKLPEVLRSSDKRDEDIVAIAGDLVEHAKVKVADLLRPTLAEESNYQLSALYYK